MHGEPPPGLFSGDIVLSPGRPYIFGNAVRETRREHRKLGYARPVRKREPSGDTDSDGTQIRKD
ncbi:hypothetical protein Plo01_18930 [Planobispora longispora]|uniref:Uncharacterized protein n=1 Tax=Planobispora longispora TaxID=28887 RepID=A0A8J3RIE4_9ACTN|nr:hypothetical protein Plo01_18930 [Planobispora longispora]